MGWRANTENETGAKRAGSKKGVYWILAGLVVAGIAAMWNWARTAQIADMA